MAVTVTRETQPRITLKGANSGTVSNGILVGSGDGERVHITFTATAEPIIVIPEGPISNVQLEAGSFPTSYIPNTADSGTVTRSPDIASIPVTAFGYNQEAGTVVVDVETFDTDYNNWVWLLDGTSDTSLYGHTSSGWRVFGAGGTVAYLGSLPGDEAAVIGYAYDASASRCVLGGGAVAGVTHSQPVAVHTLRIGSAGNSAQLNGHIKSIQYYPRRLTDAQLQELTA